MIAMELKMQLASDGISQRELARAVGVHESIISGIIRGWRNPDEDLKVKIAAFCGRPTDVLFPRRTA